jgi:hypothetical protein
VACDSRCRQPRLPTSSHTGQSPARWAIAPFCFII